MTIYYNTMIFDEDWKEKNTGWMTKKITIDCNGDEAKEITEKIFTLIDCNGSKWLGQNPDPLDELYRVLQTEPLDPTFEKYGNFMTYLDKYCFYQQNGMIRFHGNFAKLSHCFSVDTNDPEVIDNLMALITENQNSRAYQDLRP